MQSRIFENLPIRHMLHDFIRMNKLVSWQTKEFWRYRVLYDKFPFDRLLSRDFIKRIGTPCSDWIQNLDYLNVVVEIYALDRSEERDAVISPDVREKRENLDVYVWAGWYLTNDWVSSSVRWGRLSYNRGGEAKAMEERKKKYRHYSLLFPPPFLLSTWEDPKALSWFSRDIYRLNRASKIAASYGKKI